MKKQKTNIRFGIISLLILLAAFSRLIPHPPNFTPVGAMALFGAAYFSKRYLAFAVPLLAIWLSDLVLNNVLYAQYFDGFSFFYPGFYWIYSAFIAIGLIGFFLLKKIKPLNIFLASLAASSLFFLVSNFGVWASGVMYPKDFNGLLACYTAAIPFFQNTIVGDLVYCGVLFGLFETAKYKFPVL
ncbi:MAG TPA: DUF6580 family putative transport protein, partial [Flavobacterium sp.]|nr:DUF6580 family putative transport protein [Flavobacterium sp.]